MNRIGFVPVVLFAMFSVVACSRGGAGAPETTTSTTQSTEQSTTTTIPSVQEGEVVSRRALGWGDCFDMRRETSEGEEDTTTTLLVRFDCALPHESQVFGVVDHPAGPESTYPGARELLRFARAECAERFEPFVGHDFPTSRFDLDVLVPSEAEWNGGDRRIVCHLFDVDGKRTVGSAAGAGR
ncbi:MAG: hypothetical protein KatS3mg008_0902 [Acidimicrobiales bacterium]|nr:MAG: hypothetical protein KatS3mg008_0902 [Acidimicrobiales bacterium]